ncbi:hypothetical protein FOL47_002684 [Perkinsus chesapeaki]|uniref:Protein kinase domain-containing protein n=1 Tax=Perkinsus chesapeaki TaxID=330153 RepID=A0A7J6MCN7_PERCH|nr:hypothetical protein FOL47_002684 [Perkinsus chesapeaki]
MTISNIGNISGDLYYNNVKIGISQALNAIFDDYEFFDKAGEGAFGKVLVVRHKATKHVRACKAVGVIIIILVIIIIIYNNQLHSPQQRKLIQTEIDLLKSLDHPNILKLYETYVDGSNNNNSNTPSYSSSYSIRV